MGRRPSALSTLVRLGHPRRVQNRMGWRLQARPECVRAGKFSPAPVELPGSRLRRQTKGLISGRTNRLPEDPLESGPGVGTDALMDRRRLQNVGPGRSQPVKPLGGRKKRQGTAGRIADADLLEALQITHQQFDVDAIARPRQLFAIRKNPHPDELGSSGVKDHPDIRECPQMHVRNEPQESKVIDSRHSAHRREETRLPSESRRSSCAAVADSRKARGAFSRVER